MFEIMKLVNIKSLNIDHVPNQVQSVMVDVMMYLRFLNPGNQEGFTTHFEGQLKRILLRINAMLN